jgi:hypothetical protein
MSDLALSSESADNRTLVDELASSCSALSAAIGPPPMATNILNIPPTVTKDFFIIFLQSTITFYTIFFKLSRLLF